MEIRTSDAAVILRLSQREVRRMIQGGTLNARRKDGQWRLDHDEVVALHEVRCAHWAVQRNKGTNR